MRTLTKWERWRLAKGKVWGVDRDRVDYALNYLYGDLKDTALDKFSRREVMAGTLFYIQNREGH